METAKRIEKKLTECGITRTELASEMTRRGVPTSESAVTAWLAGRNVPKTAAALAMASVFRTTVEELFG